MTIDKSKNSKAKQKSQSENNNREKKEPNSRKIRLCIWAFLKRVLFTQLIFFFIGLIAFVLNLLLPKTIVSLLMAVIGVLIVIDILLILYTFWVWIRTYYLVREDSAVVFHKQSFFKEKEYFYTLNENADFKLDQSLFQQILNCGTIKIVGPTIENAIFLRGIRNPEEVLDILERISEIGTSETILISEHR